VFNRLVERGQDGCTLSIPLYEKEHLMVCFPCERFHNREQVVAVAPPAVVVAPSHVEGGMEAAVTAEGAVYTEPTPTEIGSLGYVLYTLIIEKGYSIKHTFPYK
jgi:hypothetical protein